MDRLAERDSIAVPTASLVLASGAAVALCLAPRLDAGEALFSLLWIAGWALLAWAALLGVGFAALLGVRVCSGQGVLLSEAVVTASALLLVGAVVMANPLFGEGGAAA